MSNQRATITRNFVNNSATPTTISRSVPLVVIDNNLVPDPRQANPGVINGTDGTVPFPSADNYA